MISSEQSDISILGQQEDIDSDSESELVTNNGGSYADDRNEIEVTATKSSSTPSNKDLVAPSASKATYSCTSCQTLKEEIGKMRADLEQLKQKFNFPASNQPSVSSNINNPQNELRDEINRLRADNTCLISSIQCLSKLVGNQPNCNPASIEIPPSESLLPTSNLPATVDGAAAPESKNTKKSKKERKKKSVPSAPNQPRPETQAASSQATPPPVSQDDSDRKQVVYIAGDSMIQHVQGWSLSSENRHVAVKSFSGARVEDMEDYLKPLIRKEPDELILHVGTNNIRDDNPREVAEGIVNLGFQINQNSPNTNISISSLLLRSDRPQLNDNIKETNKILRLLCNSNGWPFLDHPVIDLSCLNRRGLHLNHKGSYQLMRDFGNHLD